MQGEPKINYQILKSQSLHFQLQLLKKQTQESGSQKAEEPCKLLLQQPALIQNSKLNLKDLVKLCVSKHLDKNSAILCKFWFELGIELLQNEYGKSMKAIVLDSNSLLCIKTGNFQGNISFVNFKYQQKLQNIKDPNIYVSEFSIKELILSQQLFQKLKAGKNQKLSNLVNMPLKNKINYTTSKKIVQIDNEIDQYLKLTFCRTEDLALFLQQIYQNKFYITQKGELKQKIEKNNNHQRKFQLQPNYFPVRQQSSQIDLEHQHQKENKQISVQRIRKFKNLLKQLQIWEFLWLWKAQLKQFIQKIIKNWNMYKVQLQEEMIQFSRMVQYRLQRLRFKKIQLYDFLFRDAFESIKQLTKLLGIQQLDASLALVEQNRINLKASWQKQLLIQLQGQAIKQLNELQQNLQIAGQSFLQQAIDHYIHHRISQNRDLPLLIKNNDVRHNASQIINEKLTQFKCINYLRKTLTTVNYFLERNCQNIAHKEPLKTKEQKQHILENQNYFDSIQQERVLETRCLGCATFFKVNQNIFDQTVNTVPFKVFSSASRMRQHESQIKNEICSMLNSGGGIILFDCIELYQKILVKGITSSQKDKQQYQQRLKSYLNTFQPKHNINKCMQITFVPVVADQFFRTDSQGIRYQNYKGQESLIKQNQSYRLRPYLRNVYVTRVRICPLQGQKVYFWNQNNNYEQKQPYKIYLCSAVFGGATKDIKMSKISRFIKLKMRKHYLPQKFKAEEKKCLEAPFSVFDHKCRDPQIGAGTCLQLDDNNVFDNRQPLSQIPNSKKYQNCSLIVTKSGNFCEVKKRLLSEGVDCQIQQKFKQHQFQSSKNTAVLYHDKKFEYLLKKVYQNPKFNFNGRKMYIINITSFVKLPKINESKTFPFEDFKKLRDWLDKEFPHESLKLFEFRPSLTSGIGQYFFQTQSYESTVFIYYILNASGYKAAFKNPLHLDKMTAQERRDKFQQIYPIIRVEHIND